LADALYEKGFFSAEELSMASVEDLIQIRGIAEEKALKIIESAIKAMADEKSEESLPEESPTDISNINDVDDSDGQIGEKQPEDEITTRNEASEELTPSKDSETVENDEAHGIDTQKSSEENSG
jgi:N utilization substance protein A